MLKLSFIASSLLVIAVLAVIPSPTAAEDWPLKREIDLSSGFGDFFLENDDPRGLDPPLRYHFPARNGSLARDKAPTVEV